MTTTKVPRSKSQGVKPSQLRVGKPYIWESGLGSRTLIFRRQYLGVGGKTYEFIAPDFIGQNGPTDDGVTLCLPCHLHSMKEAA